MDTFVLIPETRMNDVDFALSLSRIIKPNTLTTVTFDFGSTRLERLNELIAFLNQRLYAQFVFIAIDGQRTVTVTPQKRGMLDMEPPITIESMDRGGIVNSITSYDLKLSFELSPNDATTLFKFLLERAHKDLTFEIKRLKKELKSKRVKK